MQYGETARTSTDELRSKHAHVGGESGACRHEDDVFFLRTSLRVKRPLNLGDSQTRSPAVRLKSRGVSAPEGTRTM